MPNDINFTAYRKLLMTALELHGVDPRRVVHGIITDDEGVN
jgi:hypothetical protein